MLSAREARIRTENNKIYRVFIKRVENHILSAIETGQYTVDIASRILGDYDDLIEVPKEVMNIAAEELEKIGYKCSVIDHLQVLRISWEVTK